MLHRESALLAISLEDRSLEIVDIITRKLVRKFFDIHNGNMGWQVFNERKTKSDRVLVKNQHTLYNDILRIARNLVETRENIKIESHPFHHIICDRFLLGWSKKKNFFLEKKIQNGRFSKSPILKIFLWKFHGLVLGLVELIDVKDIDVAQPIWSWGCPT